VATDSSAVTLDGLDATFRDAAVYLHGPDALVLADVHVGMDEASAVEFPLGERRDLAERLSALVEAFEPATVAFAGDLLHSFGRASVGTEETVSSLVAACRGAGARVVVVRGNHDTMLDAVWSGDVHDEYALADGTLVCHGHEAPGGDAPLYVVGHDHPAIAIEGQRRPCYLYGPGAYRGGDVLVLPAFTRLAAGAEVNGMAASDFQSPLVPDADALRPIVWDADADESLSFPPLGTFRRLL
jgi:hypothetical protein